LCVGSYI